MLAQQATCLSQAVTAILQKRDVSPSRMTSPRCGFIFGRNAFETRYYPMLYRNNAGSLLYSKRMLKLIVEDPAWLLLGNEIFTFDQEI
jgi:hypothetical protein